MSSEGDPKQDGEKDPATAPLVVCDACHKSFAKTFACSRCKSVRYCSRSCQKCAWRRHKPRCFPFQGDWIDLCGSPQWKYEPTASSLNELCFAKKWDGENGNQAISEVVLPPEGMHPGALAPHWVLETSEPLKEPADDMATYQRRLLSFLAGRFVCISRPDAHEESESLSFSNGIPQVAVRYWWRYWDNQGNVWQIPFEKWRRRVPDDGHVATEEDAIEATGVSYHLLYNEPGDFSSENAWLRIHQHCDFNGGNRWGPVATALSQFFEHMWFWAHKRTTYSDT